MVGDRHGTGTSPVVIALGGNTLLGQQGVWTIDAQIDAIERTATNVAAGLDAGYDIVLTHGNGPQVGNLLLEQDQVTETPRLPLDVLVAETQAQIGYLLQQQLGNSLDTDQEFLTILTQVVVDPEDPAFGNPTKPIGPFYRESEATEKPFETRHVGGDSYRRVVPSPEPGEIVEQSAIVRLVRDGTLVIAAGGGGVPVIRDDGLRGVEAVVDKDKTSQVLAVELGAEVFVILTDVTHAYLDFDTEDERPIRDVSSSALRSHLEAGEFADGSMAPKIEACIRFVESGGEFAVITTPDNLEAALQGETGTVVRK